LSLFSKIAVYIRIDERVVVIAIVYFRQ